MDRKRQLKSLRGQMCLTQEQLADKLELSRTTLAKWESNNPKEPPIYIIFACQHLLENDNE